MTFVSKGLRLYENFYYSLRSGVYVKVGESWYRCGTINNPCIIYMTTTGAVNEVIWNEHLGKHRFLTA